MISERRQLLRLARRQEFAENAVSLEKMFRVQHAEVVRLAGHLTHEWHDTNARRKFRRALDARAVCFAALPEHLTARLCLEFQLITTPEVNHEAVVE